MNDPPKRSSGIQVDPRSPAHEVFERPTAERPTADSIDAIADWIVGPARQIVSAVHAFDEFAWRMLAAGMPLLRVMLHSGVLHPQFLGTTFVWWRTTGQTVQYLIAHEVAEGLRYEDNPVWRVVRGGEMIRRHLDVADAEFDFAILHDLKAAGATDYFALPVASAYGNNYMVTYVTDRAGGHRICALSPSVRIAWPGIA